MKFLFEQMGGTYTQVGDYFIPDFVLPDTKEYHIGKYGRMHRRFLKEQRPIVYTKRSLMPTQADKGAILHGYKDRPERMD